MELSYVKDNWHKRLIGHTFMDLRDISIKAAFVVTILTA